MSEQYVPERPIFHARMSTLSERTTGAAGGVQGHLAELYAKAREIGWPDPPGDSHIVLEDDRSGWKEVPYEVDGVTYLRPDRPDLREIFRKLRSGEADGLLTVNAARGARHAKDIEELISIVKLSRVGRNGKRDINNGSPRIIVRSADDSLDLRDDKGIQNARNAVAASSAYSAAIADGVRRSHKRRAYAGIYHGGTRYGYVIDKTAPGKLRKVPEAAVVRRMADMILAGDSAWDVVKSLTESGTEAPYYPHTWNHVMVRGILLSPVVAGRSVLFGEDVADGLWERIISPEEQKQIERLLDYPRRPTYHSARRVRHLGSGLYQCGIPGCDGLMWANSMADYAGKHERGYACRKCGGQRRRISWVDGEVEAAVTEWLSREEAKRVLDRTTPDHGPEIAEIEAQLEELDRQKRQIRRRLSEGLLDDDEADEDIAANNRKRDGLRSRRSSLLPRDSGKPHPAEGLAGEPDAAEIWNDPEFPLERKRDIIREIAVVKVGPASRHGRTPPGAPPDLANIWIWFKGDGPVPELKPVTRAGVKEAIQKILAEMFDSRDSVPAGEGRERLESALRGMGYGYNHVLVCEVRAELGIIARQVSDTAWEWVRQPPGYNPGVCEGCGEKFTGYRRYQRFCSNECRHSAWKEGKQK